MSRQSDLDSEQTRSDYQAGWSRGINRASSAGQNRNTGHPQGAQTLTKMVSSRVFVNTSVLLICAASQNRNYLLIQNNGTSDVFLGFGSFPNVDGSNAMLLSPGTQYDFSSGIVPNNDVYAISTASNSVSINEGTQV